MEELAKRVVACKHWRWMRGMSDCMGGLVVSEEGMNQAPSIPDLNDPATVGCLLAMIRQAKGETAVDVEYVKSLVEELEAAQ